MRVKIFAVAALAVAALAQNFDYRKQAVDLHDTGIEVRDVTFAGASGGRIGAYLVRPSGDLKSAPGVLFVHWYDPESHDSNRSQFLGQAIDLAHEGAVSLLIDTMWSDAEWFPRRNRNDDFKNSVEAVKDLRRALDVLLSQKGVDAKRVAYVGHDFGAMYGAVLSSVDRRVSAWALQAGTTSFSDWFLLGTRLSDAERQAVVDTLAPLDPVKHIAAAAPAPVFLQFGNKDPYVPGPRAEAFFKAAKEPKKMQYYDAGHGLNAKAVADRQQWLREQLKLTAAH